MRSAQQFAKAGLVWPGGGLFFWWQAGAATGLAKTMDLSATPLVGASAGSLAATLAACSVNMDVALESAVRRSHEQGVFAKGPWGLYGIWGPIIHDWLDELLPEDADERCNGRVGIIVRELSSTSGVQQRTISEFTSRPDLIAACLASAHVPLFLDGHPTATYRNVSCVDGSLTFWGLPSVRYALPRGFAGVPSVHISPFLDPRMRSRYGRPTDFLRLEGESAVREMMTLGESFVDDGGLVELQEILEDSATDRVTDRYGHA